MQKKTLIKKYIEFFEKLLAEKDIGKQQDIAEKISIFSGEVNDEVEDKYYDEIIHDIQGSCLDMEHWKDETNYCGVKEKDIKEFLKQLKKMEH